MHTKWASSATETRECFPYRSIEDLDVRLTVAWSWRQSREEDWVQIDADHIVPPDRTEKSTWLKARLECPGDAESRVGSHLPGVELGVGLVAQSSKSRNRASCWSSWGSGVELEHGFDPSSWRGGVELRLVAFVGGIETPSDPQLGVPNRIGSPVWWSPPLRLVLDEGVPPTGAGFDVVWRDDLPPNQLYRLEHRSGGGEIQPQLQLNGSEPRIAAVWNAAGTAGRKARIRNFLNAVVSADVMTDLAILADAVDDVHSSKEDVDFKEKVRRTLRTRFGISHTALDGLDRDLEARTELHGLVQNSPPVRLVETISKLVEEVDR